MIDETPSRSAHLTAAVHSIEVYRFVSFFNAFEWTLVTSKMSQPQVLNI